LARLDKFLKTSFFVGAVAALLAGGSASYVKFKTHNQEIQLAKDNKKAPSSKSTDEPRSLSGGQKMKPGGRGDHHTGSVDGIQKLRPKVSPTTTKPVETVKPSPEKSPETPPKK
jgi:hypothetical protein